MKKVTKVEQVFIGMVIAWLTVIGEPVKRGKSYRVPCQCCCGKEISTDLYHLMSGCTRSCGCGGAVTEGTEIMGGFCVYWDTNPVFQLSTWLSSYRHCQSWGEIKSHWLQVEFPRLSPEYNIFQRPIVSEITFGAERHFGDVIQLLQGMNPREFFHPIDLAFDLREMGYAFHRTQDSLADAMDEGF